MSLNIVSERDFTVADQERFAAISGDRNPVHMDAVAARRTLVGFPVVHGIHVLLWGLDSLLRHLPDLAPVGSVRARFEKMIYVGDRAQAILIQRDKQCVSVEVRVEGIRAVRLEVTLGDAQSIDEINSNSPLFQPAEPLALTFEQMTRCHGRIPFFSEPNAVYQMFPTAANVLGAHRVAALACSSYLVGMVCPGLHSLYCGLTLVTTPISEGDHDALYFRVVQGYPRFRVVKLAVSGGGWRGFVDAHTRPPPTSQPGLASIAAKVVPGEFDKVSALVIGGSRGLGELISKTVAAGGGRVTLTFSVGEADARRVQAEIIAHGGHCDVAQYDVRANAREQISDLPSCPTQVYYLATPVIYSQRSETFNGARFQEFIKFYVTAFYDFYKELRSKFGRKIPIFYPSTVYIDTRPHGLTEYAMAKAAGELLCADIQSLECNGCILVRRLPRLPTDQTASVLRVETADPINVILPIVRELSGDQRDG
jgi:acyl dehydratase